MSATRRLIQLAALLSSVAVVLPTFAQEYPSRPVKLVVASVPGSAPDVLARVLGEKLGSILKQPVVVENKPGAGGVIGVDSVAKAPPDGYTLVIGHDGTMALSTVIHKSLPYDPVRDFVPVTPLGFNEFVLVANAGAPPKNFPQFLDYAKAQQGKITYGSAGVGTPNQIIMEQLAKEAGFTAVHVPYKGVLRQSRIWLVGRSSSWSRASPPRCRTSAPASWSPWPCRRRCAPRCCRRFPRSATRSRGSRPRAGSACSLRHAHRPRSSRG
ncbi:MAG: tripartite tricarboxylate transporter substrate binding protein [Betaproteobacteria bacterium]|nr:tripartite tricarboxylate transporter substrate binding protein [Betaproteobacteria bacterium]